MPCAFVCAAPAVPAAVANVATGAVDAAGGTANAGANIIGLSNAAAVTTAVLDFSRRFMNLSFRVTRLIAAVTTQPERT